MALVKISDILPNATYTPNRVAVSTDDLNGVEPTEIVDGNGNLGVFLRGLVEAICESLESMSPTARPTRWGITRGGEIAQPGGLRGVTRRSYTVTFDVGAPRDTFEIVDE